MRYFKNWWSNDLPIGVKITLLALLANGLPAFLILMTVPNLTEILFVWTINPTINARLVGAMYGNALLLVGFSAFRIKWENIRINMVVITLFSIFATVLTFFYLKPFLAHPWYHLAYWLSMYILLFFVAPVVFFQNEKISGGKLPKQIPLRFGARLVVSISMMISLVVGTALLFKIELVNQYWPWTLPPLVGGLIGVLFVTHAAAYAWALWDGDWLRVRSMFWQAPVTGILFALLPILHPSELHQDIDISLALYFTLVGYAIVANSFIIMKYRKLEKEHSDEK